MADVASGRWSFSERLDLLMTACRDASIKRTDVAVLSVILEHANTTTGEAWPGMTRICELAGMSKQTAIRSISRIESAGYITVERTFGRVNRYTLTGPPADTGNSPRTGNTWGKTGNTSGLRTGPSASKNRSVSFDPNSVLTQKESNSVRTQVASTGNRLQKSSRSPAEPLHVFEEESVTEADKIALARLGVA